MNFNDDAFDYDYLVMIIYIYRRITYIPYIYIIYPISHTRRRQEVGIDDIEADDDHDDR